MIDFQTPNIICTTCHVGQFWNDICLYIQELFRDFATAGQQLRTEQDMHRKQAELEERIQQRLRDAERERQVEIRKVKSISIIHISWNQL